MDILKEILIDSFDPDNNIVLRVFDNNITYIIFDEFPPENDKLSEDQVNNLAQILSDISGTKVKQDDRELFIIYSNDDMVINKIKNFFESL